MNIFQGLCLVVWAVCLRTCHSLPDTTEGHHIEGMYVTVLEMKAFCYEFNANHHLAIDDTFKTFKDTLKPRLLAQVIC